MGKKIESAREAVRGWREHMEREWGPDWHQKMRAMYDREGAWQSVDVQVHDKHGDLLVDFVVACKGGFEGERIPGWSDEEGPTTP